MKLNYRSALLIAFTGFLFLLNSCASHDTEMARSPKESKKPNVILIHGYGNILAPDTDLIKWAMTEFYWGRWVKEAFSDVEVRYIYWDATKRIEHQLGDIVEQFNGYLEEGHCPNGCLVFTHSTGGMVIDILLARSYESRGKTNDFSRIWDSTIASVNIASAAGGVGLANVLTDLVMGNCNAVLSTLFPFVECGNPSSLGAGHDLRPDEARFINQSDYVRTPSLMIAGFGLMMPSVIRLSLKGENDGLVAMHSACGGNRYPESDETAAQSCSPVLAPDGTVKPQRVPDLYRNHYPIMMTKEGHVSQLRRGALNIDFITTKTETLVLYNEQGELSKKLPERFNELPSLNIRHGETHLTDIVGDYLNLRKDGLKANKTDKGKLTRSDFRSNMKNIAISFDKEMSYPMYSRPLRKSDYALLNPGSTTTAFMEYKRKGFSAAIESARYLYFHEDSISVALLLRSYKNRPLPEMETIKGEIVDQDGKTVKSLNLTKSQSDSDLIRYEVTVHPDELSKIKNATEINFLFKIKPVRKKSETITKMLKYLPSVARVTGRGLHQVDGENLIIPVNLEVDKPGVYKMTANLFSKATGEPIAHLIGETEDLAHLGSINLKVLGEVLKEKQEKGPYLLKDFTIIRIPTTFDESRQYGDATTVEFELDSINLDQFELKGMPPVYEQRKLKSFQEWVKSLDSE